MATKKHQLVLLFSGLLLNSIIATIGIYLFFNSRLGMCIYWSLAFLYAIWTLKISSEENTEVVMIIWKCIRFILCLLLVIAFAGKHHALAVSALATMLLHGFIGTIFDAIRRRENRLYYLIYPIPFIIGYVIMIVHICKNILF